MPITAPQGAQPLTSTNPLRDRCPKNHLSWTCTCGSESFFRGKMENSEMRWCGYWDFEDLPSSKSTGATWTLKWFSLVARLLEGIEDGSRWFLWHLEPCQAKKRDVAPQKPGVASSSTLPPPGFGFVGLQKENKTGPWQPEVVGWRFSYVLVGSLKGNTVFTLTKRFLQMFIIQFCLRFLCKWRSVSKT